MFTNLAANLPVTEPFLALYRQTWGVIGVGAVLAVFIIGIIFYMLGSHSERH